jgi:hypothetical protein
LAGKWWCRVGQMAQRDTLGAVTNGRLGREELKKKKDFKFVWQNRRVSNAKTV